MDSVFSLAEQCGADGAPAGIGGRVGFVPTSLNLSGTVPVSETYETHELRVCFNKRPTRLVL